MDVVWPNGTKTKPYVSSSFGPRRAPVPGASTYHRGTDFSHTFGRVRAIAAGRVVVVGTPPGWLGGGTQVWIQHDGFFSKSLHMVSGSPAVRVGDWVSAAQDLGEMGETGTATDVHLHFEIAPGAVHYRNTGQVDPVPFITSRLASTAGGSAGGSAGEEDDMYTDADRKRDQNTAKRADAVYAAVFGARNLTGKDDPIQWVNRGGGTQLANYGLLAIDIHTQTLVAQQSGRIAAIEEVVEQLAKGSGAVLDMKAISAAAEAGTRKALSGLTLTADVG